MDNGKKILTRCAGNPKSEIRNPKEIRMLKKKIRNQTLELFRIYGF